MNDSLRSTATTRDLRARLPRMLTVCVSLAVLWGTHPVLDAAAGEIPGSGATIDMRRWNPDTEPIVELAGEWDVYWRRFVRPPGSQERGDAPPPDGRQRLPATWNRWSLDGTEVGGRGFATYAVTLLLPGDVSRIALMIPPASTAYTLWANGDLVARSGTPGRSEETSVPHYVVQTTTVDVDEPRVELVAHVSNFHHRRGGLWRPIRIGRPDDIQARVATEMVYDLLLVGSFLAMAASSLLLLHASRKWTRAPLFLAIILLALAIRIPMVGQMIASRIWVGMPWGLQLRVEYLTGHAVLAAFVGFYRALYPRIIARWFTLSVVWFAAAHALATVVLNVRVYSHVVPVYGYVMVAVIGVVGAALVAAGVRGERVAWQGAAGALLAFVAALGEQLHYQEILLSREFAPFTWIVSLLARSIGSRIPDGPGTYVVSVSLNLLLLFGLASVMVVRGSRSLVRATRLGSLPSRPTPVLMAELKRGHGITRREAEIMALVAEGKTNAEIAAELFVSVATVKTHMYRIMQKLDVESRHHVGRHYLERLLEMSE